MLRRVRRGRDEGRRRRDLSRDLGGWWSVWSCRRRQHRFVIICSGFLKGLFSHYRWGRYFLIASIAMLPTGAASAATEGVPEGGGMAREGEAARERVGRETSTCTLHSSSSPLRSLSSAPAPERTPLVPLNGRHESPVAVAPPGHPRPRRPNSLRAAWRWRRRGRGTRRRPTHRSSSSARRRSPATTRTPIPPPSPWGNSLRCI